jgi:hypothetical protein
VAARRAGKTVAVINDDIKCLLRHQRRFPVPQGVFISPTFAQSKRNAWAYVKEYCSTLPGARPLEGELTMLLPNGARYILTGSDNYEALRGMYLDRATLDEFASQDPRVWGEVVRPALSDYAGSANFIGSAKGRNAFYDMYEMAKKDPNWYTDMLKASVINHLSQEELQLARETMTPEQYAQEYECSFDSAVQGAFYGADIEQAENEKRICGVPYDKAADVYAAWDLGIGNAMAVWEFQLVGKEWHWLRYIENTGKGLDWYLDEQKSRPYKIDLHILPHDAKAKELQSGKTREQFFEDRGHSVFVCKREFIQDGIHAVKMMLNKSWFDKENTRRGIDCLRMYRSQLDTKNNVLSDKPLHDWTSNGADAMRTGVMGVREKFRPVLESSGRERVPQAWMG